MSLYPMTAEAGMREAVTEGMRIRVSAAYILHLSQPAFQNRDARHHFAYRSVIAEECTPGSSNQFRLCMYIPHKGDIFQRRKATEHMMRSLHLETQIGLQT